MNSVCILANRVHWTRFVLNYTVACVASQAHKKTITSGAQKNQHTKKTKFKLRTSPSHSQSLPLTRLSLTKREVAPSPAPSSSLSLSAEPVPSTIELSLTLRRACRSVASTIADCSRRRRCLSLPSVHLRVTQSFSLSGWQTTPQSKDSLFSGCIGNPHALYLMLHF